MDAGDTPPITTEAAPPYVNRPIARWRWWTHLLVLTALPIAAGILGLVHNGRTKALLPANISGLLLATAEQIVIFTVLFVVAWVASRVNGRQLRLQWRGGFMPVIWGVAYSVALRLLIAAATTTAVVSWLLFKTMIKHGQSPDLNHSGLRPQVENLINLQALQDNPVYFVLMLTLISFVLGGLREELWRAAMFAGIDALFPRAMTNRSGQAVAILVVAALFGLAHTPQGWVGVGVITLLGAGLGAIMVWHKSIWEAVLAHGFFDAATFALLYALGKFSPHELPF
jgi:membrane protease YdiL (CAAX protease family)